MPKLKALGFVKDTIRFSKNVRSALKEYNAIPKQNLKPSAKFELAEAEHKLLGASEAATKHINKILPKDIMSKNLIRKSVSAYNPAVRTAYGIKEKRLHTAALLNTLGLK